MPIKYMVPFFIAFSLAGCAGSAPVRAEQAPAGVSQGQPVSREELLMEAGAKPREAAGKKDDFIEVDDKKGFLKSWPMVLFVGLIAAAMGAL